ncbi:MAG: glycosyltransferase family 4 protein, partial [Nanoarchaeota archaeon]|nr:glycosyltransferase family 4 protein [Nanoarchaeota archaeon]
YLFSYGDEDIREEKKVVVKHSNNALKRHFDKFVFNFKVYKELKKYIRRIKPDITFVHNNYVYAIPLLLALKQENIHTIQTVHDWGQICPSSWCVIKRNLKRCKGAEGISTKCLLEKCISPNHFLATYLRNKIRIKLTKKTIKKFISPSKMLAKDLAKHGFKNVSCIHHFKEFGESKFSTEKSQKGLIIYVGVLSRNKGVDFLIKAFKLILQKYPDALLRIIGDGPERENLEKLSKRLNIESKIDFKGKIPHAEVLKEFEKSRLFVIPSVWMENSPFVVYECMSIGRPIVGSNRGGIPDLVLHKKTGLIVEPGRPEEIAEAVLKILKDDDLFKRFSKNAFEYVHKELSTQKHIMAIEKVLK